MVKTFSNKDTLQRFESDGYGEAFPFAGKSTNLYEISNPNYNRLLGNNNYRNAEMVLSIKSTTKLKTFAELLDLSKNMECFASPLPLLPLKITNQNCEIILNVD